MDALSLYHSCDQSAIARWVAEQQEENLHLDFKALQREDFTHSDDKKNLAKALSGFANSDGGLIVWGVDARPNHEKVDCAVAVKLIADLPRVLARLNEYTGDFVSPRVNGVMHRPVPFPPSGGCVVTYVPESDTGPHMAKGGEHRYFKRSGSAFYMMEHFDIEDMFGRRRRPILTVSYRFEGRGGMGSGGTARHHTAIVLQMSNTGRGIAKSPYMAIRVTPPLLYDTTYPSGLPRLPTSLAGVIQFGASSAYVIHPGVTIDVAAFRYDIINERGHVMAPAPVQLDFEVAAEDSRLAADSIQLSSADLVHGRFPDGVVPMHV